MGSYLFPLLNLIVSVSIDQGLFGSFGDTTNTDANLRRDTTEKPNYETVACTNQA